MYKFNLNLNLNLNLKKSIFFSKWEKNQELDIYSLNEKKLFNKIDMLYTSLSYKIEIINFNIKKILFFSSKMPNN